MRHDRGWPRSPRGRARVAAYRHPRRAGRAASGAPNGNALQWSERGEKRGERREVAWHKSRATKKCKGEL
eukprot:scaffold290835_cov22-Tisochrysis_lutea.AAC.1